MKKTFLILFALIVGITFSACKKNNAPAEAAKEELTVDKEDGFCATHEFSNNVWTFPKNQKGNGDIEIDKSLKIKGNLPDCANRYDLAVIVDFYPEIEAETLPLDITTISPDGKTKQSCSLKVDFNDKERVKEIVTTNGKGYKRYTKVLYPQKKFTASGTYTFDIYSKYSKLSLYGIKAISVKLVENNKKK